MNDTELRQHVIDELEFEPSLDAANIGVAAERGVVTLTGHVSSYSQKVAAERATWRVEGVKAIAQEIQVRLPGDRQLADDEIARRAINILAWDDFVPKDAVKLRVASGWITLTGAVTWNYQRNAAESQVRKLSGVAGVSNDITLVPQVSSTDVRQRIVNALKRNAEVEAERIHVDVRENGVVKVDGVVDDWDERQAVERAVWSAPGVHSVDARLRIA
ncbi:BON domain-containing protein [Chiayiivirga flava]|uniref:Osmotically-inducible protein OsmY n=1 Tax=Chiayiivirga flava TaxID=659595 RepID=A0A7W8D4G6_9GAMM|nr:BON domain-containing protein [Chiayiivirga flava]MBB5206521.1 osmotically-inducible protein OsmY [Chiayiivirga flava]